MKLSEQTLKILKNYATINQSILFKPGNAISTCSNAGNIVAIAEIEEEFNVEFCIYDLVEFLNTLKLFKSPLLDFRDADNNFLSICEEENTDFRVKYTFANKEHIKYPNRKPVMGNADITFTLDTKTLDSITKASNVMQLPNLMILPGDETGFVKIEVSDVKDRSSNKFSIAIPAEVSENRKFKLFYKMDSIKMISNEYDVTISGSKLVSVYESDTIEYYIGLHPNSRW